MATHFPSLGKMAKLGNISIIVSEMDSIDSLGIISAEITIFPILIFKPSMKRADSRMAILDSREILPSAATRLQKSITSAKFLFKVISIHPLE